MFSCLFFVWFEIIPTQNRRTKTLHRETHRKVTKLKIKILANPGLA